MNNSILCAMGLAVCAIVLTAAAGPAGAALVGVDDNVFVDQAFSDGKFVYDTFSAPGSAVGFANNSFGGTDWGLTSDRYVAGNGGTVVQVQGANKTRYLSSAINYDASAGANNTYWAVVVMANSTYGGGSNTSSFGAEGALITGTLNWTNGYRAQSTFVPSVSQDSAYHTFVVKMTWTATGTRETTAWFDPDLSQVESAAANTAAMFVDNASASNSNVRLYIFSLSASDADSTFDYFGVSTGSPFVTAPVPEPATLALLRLGGLALAGRAARRRRRA